MRGLARKRFVEEVESEVFKDLSRPTSQREEYLNAPIRSAEKESLRRFEELVQAVRRPPSVESVERSAVIKNHLRLPWAEIESLCARQA